MNQQLERAAGATTLRSVLAAALFCGLQAGCGGGDAGWVDPPVPFVASAALAGESDYGPGDRPEAASLPTSDSAAMPADHAARTRPGLYLRRADAERWEQRLRGDVVWVDAGCCAGDTAEMALLTAYGMQAAKNLGNDAPFFVTGSNQRLAATLVNRLAETGSRNAFLVTP